MKPPRPIAAPVPGDGAPVTLSVIVPFHRGFGQLKQTLRALRGQTYPRSAFEIIAINNDPDEVTLPPLQAEFPDVRWLQEEEVGSYCARNRGVAAARGEWLAFTDSDCVPTPAWLAEGVRMIRDSDCDLFGGRVDYIDPKGRSKNAAEWLEEEFTLLHKQRWLVENLGVVATANLFARRSLFERVGGFNPRLMSFGDGDWTRRAKASGARLGYADTALTLHPRRSRVAELLTKTLRTEGDRINFMRCHGATWRMHLVQLWRNSALDPRSYVRAWRAGGEVSLGMRLKIVSLMLYLSGRSTVEKLRVLLRGKPIRG
ncbi:glycosyltransferase family 2 protein [Synoicihabitans lomoniglobus]|uniref:Glycosyltransferase n=1 Tax=Synoicihabitans lomoniglobus TaxID=2909285 RepID=A0AAE9ZWF2_9BACT|nr:glycosyltransferase [Opitutaceae bacterium LMO-M01]WED64135.1 glycosyltransferase [Opitutaceae bacterium LMO-M01]